MHDFKNTDPGLYNRFDVLLMDKEHTCILFTVEQLYNLNAGPMMCRGGKVFKYCWQLVNKVI